MRETPWDVIKNYIGLSLYAMLGGLFPLIPLGGIWFGVVYFLAEDKTEQIGSGATFVLVLIYAFSIGLWTTYFLRQSDEYIRANEGLRNQIAELNHDDSEINRRVSVLVDRLEEEEEYPDENDVDILDTVALLNDIRRELEFIRDKQFVNED